MAESIYTWLKEIASSIGGVAYVVCLSILTLAFICSTALAFTNQKFTVSVRKKTVFIPIILCLLLLTISALGGINISMFYLAVTLSVVYGVALYFLPVKEKKISEEEKELIKFIDDKISESCSLNSEKILEKPVQTKSTADENFNGEFLPKIVRDNLNPPLVREKYCSPTMEINESKKKPVQEKVTKKTEKTHCEKKTDNDLDFTHVRNVISRLNYFGLSQADRRQVHDLEAWLLEAERGYDGKEVKEKINDGLSSLLRIMSKYGA